MANINNNKEPSTAPQPEKWYNLRLGSSFKDNLSTKFCTLRYEFKPASIDKNQAGSLHKSKENRVTVEFNNNQPGKPKVAFDGSCEDYKENDAVLFFDGETFRLERLHRAMKRLRHVRLPGESMAAASVASGVPSVGPAIESRSPPIGKATKPQQFSKPIVQPVPIEVERIDIGEPDSPVAKPTSRSTDYLSPARLNQSTASPDPNNLELDENLDIVVDDDEQIPNNTTGVRQELNTGFDMNQNDTDDEIADVDVSDDDAEKGPNAAEALRAQVNAEGGDVQSSSSSDSSGSASGGSGSGSATSSSSNDGSDDDSASSGGDIDIE